MKHRYIWQLLVGALLLCAPVSSLSAAVIWYLHADQASTDNYNSVATWFNSPSGGTAATQMNAGDVYDTNGKLVRTANINGVSNFTGGTLQIDGGSLALKAVTSNVGNIVVTSVGGTIQNSGPSGGGGVATLNTTNFTANGAVSFNLSTQTALTVNIASLTGSGGISLANAGTGQTFLGFTSLTGYNGLISVGANTKLSLTNGFTSQGGLIIASNAQIIGLNDTVTFTSLTIAGNVLGVGNYSYADLKGLYSSIFTSNTSSGMISVVPEPSAAGLALAAFGVWFARVIVVRRKITKAS